MRRVRTWRVRKSVGEPLTMGCSGEVRMRRPTEGNAAVPRGESIGSQERTEGSETSQYLEEKKANAIPSVVASESGTGQTAGGNSVGGVGPHLGPVLCRRAVWKGGPQSVKAP